MLEAWSRHLEDIIQLQEDKPDYSTDAYLHQQEWTAELLMSERQRLNTQAEHLHELLNLREKEIAKLNLAEARVHNAHQKISRLPDDVLLVIFEYFVWYSQRDPATLASVCYRWSTVVLGDGGTVVWSHLYISPWKRSMGFGSFGSFGSVYWTPVDVQRLQHFIWRSRTHPLYVHFAQGQASLEITALLDAQSHRIRTIDVAASARLPQFAAGSLFSELRRLSAYDYVSDFPPSGLSYVPFSSSSPSLKKTTLKMRAVLLVPALQSLSSCAQLTHLVVDLRRLESPDISALYHALASFPELSYLKWSDTWSPTPSHPLRIGALPNLTTLILHGHPAIHAFSVGIEAPTVEHLHLNLPSDEVFAPPDVRVFASTNLLRPSTYVESFPQLKLVKYSNLEIPTLHLFSLLTNHPTLREVYWEGSFEVAEDLLTGMAFVLTVGNRISAGVERDAPFLTLGHPSRSPDISRKDVADAPLAKGRKGAAQRRREEAKHASEPSPSPTQLAIGLFGDALAWEMQDMPSEIFARSNVDAASSFFRLGIAAQVVASSPKLSRTVQKWPHALSVRPYNVDWVFENDFD